MKKILMAMMTVLLLAGCAEQPVMETVADDLTEPAAVPVRQIQVNLPDEAAVPTVEGSGGRIYLCEDYEIVIQTMAAGDLDATVRALSGYDRQRLTVISTRPADVNRYDFVWATAGEEGDRLGRAVILDDGNYHYTMTVLRDADTTENSQIVWRSVFESFRLA